MRIITGTIMSRFGYRTHPVTGERKMHNGVDISAPIGTSVFSPVDGEVMEAYTCQYGGGLTLTVANENKEVRFSFAHLNSVALPIGAKVKKGQKVAESGNTGTSTGPHLHFGAKTNGKWVGKKYIGGFFVNPEPYLNF